MHVTPNNHIYVTNTTTGNPHQHLMEAPPSTHTQEVKKTTTPNLEDSQPQKLFSRTHQTRVFLPLCKPTPLHIHITSESLTITSVTSIQHLPNHSQNLLSISLLTKLAKKSRAAFTRKKIPSVISDPVNTMTNT